MYNNVYKTSKLSIFVGEPPTTGEFPSHRASNGENASMSGRYNVSADCGIWAVGKRCCCNNTGMDNVTFACLGRMHAFGKRGISILHIINRYYGHLSVYMINVTITQLTYQSDVVTHLSMNKMADIL